MDSLFNTYQLILVFLLIAWIVPVLGIWVRYDRLPHKTAAIIAIFLWPTTLLDEMLRGFHWWQAAPYLAGVFQFAPVLIATLLTLSVERLVIEQKPENPLRNYIPTAVLFAGQIPFLLLPQSEKTTLLLTPPSGQLLTYWPYYVPYLFSGFVLLYMVARALERLGHYHQNLSDQVVDVNFYRFRALNSAYIGMVVVAFVVIAIATGATFGFLPAGFWQTLINLLQSGGLLILLVLMLEKRRYAPAPFSQSELEEATYTDAYLRVTLQKAEQAIIHRKAYKHIGLRIRQLADAADVEPLALAVATRSILKRNFRAFIYHYRLEYAKKVLMRTDAKVSSVAKRLGFNSEKFLSTVFIKYIEMMGKEHSPKEEEGLF